MLDLYDLSGTLLYRYSLAFPAQFLASTSGYEEIRVLAGSADRAVLISLDMGRLTRNMTEPLSETGVKIDYLNITMSEEAVIPLEGPVCSLQHYVKLGNKQWVIADCKGNFQLLSFNGTLIRQTQLDNPFIKLDRFGQQLSYLTEGSIGHMQIEAFKPLQACHLHSRALDMTIDSSYSITQLHVLLETGELYVIDTANDCKRVSKHFAERVSSNSKVLSLRGGTLVWTGLELLYFDREGENPQALPVKGGKGLLASQRVQSGSSYIAIDTTEGVRLYEFVAPHKSASSFDFGSLRFVVVLFVIGLVVLWQVMKKSKEKIKAD